MSEHTPRLDSLREHVRILASILDDPEPGLFAWKEALYERIQEIKQFALSPLDHAAPDLLASCKVVLRHDSEDFLPEGTWTETVRQVKAAIAKATQK